MVFQCKCVALSDLFFCPSMSDTFARFFCVLIPPFKNSLTMTILCIFGLLNISRDLWCIVWRNGWPCLAPRDWLFFITYPGIDNVSKSVFVELSTLFRRPHAFSAVFWWVFPPWTIRRTPSGVPKKFMKQWVGLLTWGSLGPMCKTWTHVLSANLDSDNTSSCCVPDECPRLWRISRWFMFFLLFLGRNLVLTSGLGATNVSRGWQFWREHQFFFLGTFAVLVNSVGIWWTCASIWMALNISVIMYPFAFRVSVSTWTDTEKISTSLRRCWHPSIENCSQVLSCTVSAILCKRGHFALLQPATDMLNKNVLWARLWANLQGLQKKWFECVDFKTLKMHWELSASFVSCETVLFHRCRCLMLTWRYKRMTKSDVG